MPIQNIPPKDQNRTEKLNAFDRLLTIMDELRINCPWDKKQTIQSIRHLSIEEVYELSDAILQNDTEEIQNELGDLMLHIVFYSKIASETGDFDIADVLNGICEKMIRRHPHIYGDIEVENEEDVKRNWEKIKLKEKKDKRVLEGVPTSLPSLVKAVRIQEKARGVGFDWDNKEDVWEKVQEEIQEFKEAPTQEEKEKEFGDILFSLVNYARFEGINPVKALEKTNQKFINRFNHIEQQAIDNQTSIENLSVGEMNEYWEEAKKEG
ncbi:MAG: nucleoside triphosphate pyrophosphohydrolase [Cytophagales bacterium]|nr:nucleoside triphosphate pyrophosphohydrolase [Cytophagales bacterium]